MTHLRVFSCDDDNKGLRITFLHHVALIKSYNILFSGYCFDPIIFSTLSRYSCFFYLFVVGDTGLDMKYFLMTAVLAVVVHYNVVLIIMI